MKGELNKYQMLRTLVIAALAFFISSSTNVSAQTPGQSDHAILDAGDEDAIFCGVRKAVAEPYTLRVSASATEGEDLVLRITFRDGDSVAYPIPDGTSFSVTHTLGGVPNVDDQVKITLEGDSAAGFDDPTALASVNVKGDKSTVKDPFTGDGESDNFCLTFDSDSGEGDPGDDAANSNFLVP